MLTQLINTAEQTTIHIDALRLDGGTQPRDGLDAVYVTELAQALHDGATLPPVAVMYDGANYWLYDGYHRVAAHRESNFLLVPATIHQGDQQAAQWESYAANQSHGLRRSNDDKRRATLAALRHPNAATLSNREIARHLGVDEKTIRTWREKLESSAEIPQIDGRMVQRGEQTYTQNTTNIGANRPPVSKTPPTREHTVNGWFARTRPAHTAIEELAATRPAAPPTPAPALVTDGERPLPAWVNGDGDANSVQPANNPDSLAERLLHMMSHSATLDQAQQQTWLKSIMQGNWRQYEREIACYIDTAQIANDDMRTAGRIAYMNWLAMQETAQESPISNPPIPPLPVSQRDDYDSDEWYTPADIITAARQVMGSIALDPATSELAQTVVQADAYLTRADNGLSQSAWLGETIWLNPPYSQTAYWVDKLLGEYAKGTFIRQAMVLVNNATETAWFQSLLAFPVCLPSRRLAFWRHDHANVGARQGQAIFYIGPNIGAFIETFSQFGPILQRIAQ